MSKNQGWLWSIEFLNKLIAFRFIAENGKSVINVFKIKKRFRNDCKEQIFVKYHKNDLPWQHYQSVGICYYHNGTRIHMIFGTWVERLNVCRTESASMCRSLFGTEPVKNVNNQNGQKNWLTQYRTVTQRLETICYITKNVHLTIRTINFLFFLKHDLISIYQS